MIGNMQIIWAYVWAKDLSLCSEYKHQRAQSVGQGIETGS